MDISAFYHFSSMQFISLLLSLLLLLNNNYQIDASENNTHNVAKRLDIDTCADRFDIRTSTIIRTEESKTMGAKFINDDDVSSVNACMKLCCETKDCDVFVYEEKSTGSCFLFHCGTSDDFRCKFTTHSNYTSGVLTVSRKDLESPPTVQPATVVKKPKLSQNELELVNLKRPSNSYHSLSPTTTSTSVSPPFAMRMPADIITTSTASPISSSKSSSCGRFQFQCQTSKECIAIYNVCDQIAQCEDGSDEGPECPTSGNKNENLGRNQGNNFAQMPRPMIHNREDPMTAPKYPPVQSQVYSDSEIDNNNVNYFNVQKQNTKNFPDRIQPNQYLVPQLSPQQTMDEAIYREQPQWPQTPSQQVPKQTNSVWPEKLGRKNHADEKSNQSRKKIQTNESEYSDEYTDESQADNEEILTTTEAPKKKPRKHKKVKVQKEKSSEKSLHDQLKQLKNTSPSDVDVQLVDHDEKPTGAVLSLTLGCLILAALSVLIGCRLRRVNVRRRRGKSVEEADYLVNGLYL